jgi:hypothetical protein
LGHYLGDAIHGLCCGTSGKPQGGGRHR